MLSGITQVEFISTVVEKYDFQGVLPLYEEIVRFPLYMEFTARQRVRCWAHAGLQQMLPELCAVGLA